MPRRVAQILFENYNGVHRDKGNNRDEGAFRMGYIDHEQITKLAEPMVKNGYGEYLLRLAEEKEII